MKKLVLICTFLMAFIAAKAQATIYNLGEGLDCTQEYSTGDHYIEGSMFFCIRTDGTRYLTYDVILNATDPWSYIGLGIVSYGYIYINNQKVDLNFPSWSSSGSGDGEIGYYVADQTELDSSVELEDIGYAYISVDCSIREYCIAFNW